MSTPELAAALTDIRVEMARMSGRMDTMGAALEGTLTLHGSGIVQLREQVGGLDGHVEDLVRWRERARGKAIGLATAAALASSGVTVGGLKLLSGVLA